MATNNSHQATHPVQEIRNPYTDFDPDDDDENDSLRSIETDDGTEHTPEKILAQSPTKQAYVHWYLVKWRDCPILRSSWEGEERLLAYPWVLDAWIIEKQKQAEGKSKPLDIEAYHQAIFELEQAERNRRKLRRLKRTVIRILSRVDT